LGGFGIAGLIASGVLVVVHGAETIAMQICCRPNKSDSADSWPRSDVLQVLAFGAFHLFPLLKSRRKSQNSSV
jgi:uncharacterized protein YhhL (DUF1145 family)